MKEEEEKVKLIFKTIKKNERKVKKIIVKF